MRNPAEPIYEGQSHRIRALTCLVNDAIEEISESDSGELEFRCSDAGHKHALEAIAHLGGPEAKCLALLAPISGDFSGYMAFIEAQSDNQLQLDEKLADASLNTGRELFCSFASSLSRRLELDLFSEDPVIALEMASAIVSSMVAEAEWNNTVIFTFDANLTDSRGSVSGCFLYIPSVNGFELMTQKLLNAEAA